MWRPFQATTTQLHHHHHHQHRRTELGWVAGTFPVSHTPLDNKWISACSFSSCCWCCCCKASFEHSSFSREIFMPDWVKLATWWKSERAVMPGPKIVRCILLLLLLAWNFWWLFCTDSICFVLRLWCFLDCNARERQCLPSFTFLRCKFSAKSTVDVERFRNKK